ncbi:MAG: ABC transporter permease [Dictyoglomus sp.]|nr:ABC transporter permease [Dictyoglomus sp.]MCX7941913.1 ABC transporter permease [Dictyoglomaceae bacterium]MDW8188604.1 ABC transporter permease [Dictyoglomus sp.]
MAKEIALQQSIRKPRSLWKIAWKRLAKNKLALVGLSIVIIIVIIAIFADYIAPYDPLKVDLSKHLLPPSREHLLGTDEFGRDILSRIIFGARVSLQIGFFAQVISISLGTVLGLLAGFYGGWVDDVIMRIVEILFAFPFLLFVIAVVAVFGPGIQNLYLAVAIIGWAGVARIVRGQVLSLRERDFVASARAIGAGTWRILFRHILPNALSPIIIEATLGMGGMIMLEAGLSFLGLGVQAPTPSWGSMVQAGLAYMRSAWWYPVFPGIVIMIIVFGFNLLGDGLRDALDPRLYI